MHMSLVGEVRRQVLGARTLGCVCGEEAPIAVGLAHPEGGEAGPGVRAFEVAKREHMAALEGNAEDGEAVQTLAVVVRRVSAAFGKAVKVGLWLHWYFSIAAMPPCVLIPECGHSERGILKDF